MNAVTDSDMNLTMLDITLQCQIPTQILEVQPELGGHYHGKVVKQENDRKYMLYLIDCYRAFTRSTTCDLYNDWGVSP